MPTYHPTKKTTATLGAGDVRDPNFRGSSRSARINGLIQRFEAMYSDTVAGVEDIYQNHKIQLWDLMIAEGGAGSWLGHYLADVEPSPYSFPRASLIFKLSELTPAQLAALEERIARGYAEVFQQAD